MSIQVLSLAAAMGEKNKNHGLQPAISSPLSLSPKQGNSPILSAIAARNATHLAQLRALSSPTSLDGRAAGLLTSVSQESEKVHLNVNSGVPVDAAAKSGIVSHLRARGNHATASAASQGQQDFLLRAKVAAAMSSRDAAWALGSPGVLPRTLLSSGTRGFLNSSLAVAAAPSPSMLNQSPRLSPDLFPSEALLTKILRLSNTSAGPAPFVAKNSFSAPIKPNLSKAARQAAIPLYMDCDEESLSEYQCLIRQQMELFEASADDAAASVQGRNKQILPKQVGIRCRHCAHSSKASAAASNSAASKGSMYFPTKLDRIYQAAQNLSAFHLCDHCPLVPPEVRKRILLLRERKSPAGGGKRYWAEGVRCLGVVEDAKQGGLRFKTSAPKN